MDDCNNPDVTIINYYKLAKQNYTYYDKISKIRIRMEIIDILKFIQGDLNITFDDINLLLKKNIENDLIKEKIKRIKEYENINKNV